MRIRGSLALLAALSVVAVSCGSDDGGDTAATTTPAPAATEAPATTQAPETTAAAAETTVPEPVDLGGVTVVIGTTKTFEFLPAYLGLELGVWEKRGLAVENLEVQGSAQVAQTMAAGEGEIAVTAGASGVRPIMAGLEARIVGEIGRNFNMMVMVTGADSDIQAMEDLKGKTVGITSQGSLTDFLARRVIAVQGWAEGDMNIAPIGGFTEQVAALESGAIDAFIWSAEAGFQLEEQGTGRVVFNYGDLVENNVFEVIKAMVSAIEERPDAIKAYLEGWYEAVQYMKDNPEEAVAFCVAQYELSEYVCQSTYDLDMSNMSSDGVIPQPNLEGLANSVVNAENPTAPAIDAFFDGRFLPIEL